MTPFPLRRAALVLTLAAACGPALSQSAAALLAPATPGWPSKPVKLVVGFPAGSSPDLVARTLAEPLSQSLGQPVIVENKVGAGGNIAADAVAKATDDHTLGVMINGNLTIARLINPRINYDPLKDLAPISLIATAPLALAAPANAPGATAQAFVAAARASGNRWSYGTPGVGTVAHIGMELLKAKAGIAPVHVPYPGNPQVITGLIGGQVQMALLPPGLAMAQVKGGKLQAVGVTSTGRSSVVPEVASLADAGVQGLQLEIWNAVAAPVGMPKAHVQKLATLLAEIVRRPEIRQKILNQGWQVAGTSPEGLAKRIAADTAAMADVIQKNNIKAN